MDRSLRKSNQGYLLEVTGSDRIRLEWRYRTSRLKNLMAWIFYIAFVGIFGGMCLFYGSGSLRVDCVKEAPGTRCEIQNSYFFGQLARKQAIDGVMKAELVTSGSVPRNRLTRIVLTTTSGTKELGQGASNVDYDRKRKILRELNAFLEDPKTPLFQKNYSKWNLFGLLGAMLGLFTICSAIVSVFSSCCPIFLEWTPSRQEFRYRAKMLQIFAKVLPVSKVKAFRQGRHLGQTTFMIQLVDEGKILFSNWYGIPRDEFIKVLNYFAPLIGQDPLAAASMPAPEPIYVQGAGPDLRNAITVTLPLVITRGSMMARNAGIILILATLLYLIYLSYLGIRDDHYDLGSWVFGIALLSLANRLLKNGRTVVSSETVECTTSALLWRRSWSEPISNYQNVESVKIVRKNDSVADNHVYEFRLIHRSAPKRNIRLARRANLTAGEAFDLQNSYSQALNLQVNSSLPSIKIGEKPLEIKVDQRIDGTMCLTWPAMRVTLFLFIGLFFCFLGSFGAVGGALALLRHGTGFFGLILAMIPVTIGGFVMASYFIAKEILEVKGDRIAHGFEFLGFKKVGEMFPISEITKIHFQLSGTGRSAAKSRSIIISGSQFEMNIAGNLSSPSQDWLCTKLTELFKTGKGRAEFKLNPLVFSPSAGEHVRE